MFVSNFVKQLLRRAEMIFTTNYMLLNKTVFVKNLYTVLRKLKIPGVLLNNL